MKYGIVVYYKVFGTMKFWLIRERDSFINRKKFAKKFRTREAAIKFFKKHPQYFPRRSYISYYSVKPIERK